MNNLSRGAGALGLMLVLAGSAYGGRGELADTAFDCATAATCASPTDQPSNFESDGQYWHFDSSATTGSLSQIALDFGTGPQVGRPFVFDRAQGTVTFSDGSFVDPLHLPSGYDPSYVSNAVWSYGELARVYLNTNGYHFGSFTYDPATTLKAYRFDWTAQCPADADCIHGNPFLSYQAIFIEIDPETFLLELNYDNSGADYSLSGAKALVDIGGTDFETDYDPSSPLLVTVGQDFCFHDGQPVDCAAVLGVPEPPASLLVLAGLLTLFLMTGRRRLGFRNFAGRWMALPG